MATIRDKLGHCCFEAGNDGVPRESAPISQRHAGGHSVPGHRVRIINEQANPFSLPWWRGTEGQWPSLSRIVAIPGGGSGEQDAQVARAGIEALLDQLKELDHTATEKHK